MFSVLACCLFFGGGSLDCLNLDIIVAKLWGWGARGRDAGGYWIHNHGSYPKPKLVRDNRIQHPRSSIKTHHVHKKNKGTLEFY